MEKKQLINKKLLDITKLVYQRIAKTKDYVSIDALSKGIVCGATPSTRNKKNWNGDIQFVTVECMTRIYTSESERKITQFAFDSAKRKVPENSILVSCIGTIGPISLSFTECQTNQQINSIIPNEKYRYFVLENLCSRIEELKMLSSGSTMPNISKSLFSGIKIFKPAESDLCNFNKIVQPIYAEIKKNICIMIQLKKAKLLLLNKYF